MTRKRRFATRIPLLTGVLAAAVVVMLAALLSQAWREIAMAQAEDAVMRVANLLQVEPAPKPDIVVVDIDQATIQQIGAWPWPRERLGALVGRMATTKPAALALDMLLADADPRSPIAELKRRGAALEADTLAALTRAAPDGDAVLAGVLAEVPGVLGLVLDPAQTGHAPAAQVLVRGTGKLHPLWQGAGIIGPHRPLMQAASGLGIIALPGDADGVIRRLPLFVTAAGAPYPGLALEILRVWQDASAFVVQGPPAAVLVGDRRLTLPDDALLRLVPGRFDGPAIRHVSARDILSGASTIAPGAFVLVGGSAPALGGLRIAQDDALVPAVTIQARALAQVLAGIVPRAPPQAGILQAVLLLLAPGLAIWAALALGPVHGLLALISGLASLLAASVGLFLGGHWLLAPLLPAVAAVTAFGGTSVVSFVETRRREARIRQRFEQHLAPQVVSMIIADPGLLKLRGEKREITALFTDVEDFTAMTERAEPEALVGVLDDYFEGLAEILVRHGGMIDKIVGDAIHAFFNAPLDLADHPAKALACAIDIAHWSDAFRSRPAARAIGFGRTRIGIETGPAVVGDVGIRSKLDYTAHGAVVNSAARLEAANKIFASTICLGPRISGLLPQEALRPLGEVQLRGFSTASRVFEPWPEATSPAWRQRYIDAAALAERNPPAAAALFEELAEEAAGDDVCRRRAAVLRQPRPA
jgi:adenylate cyclase